MGKMVPKEVVRALARAGMLALVLIVAGAAAAVAANGSLSWQSGVDVLPPVDAEPGQNIFLNSVACPVAGGCLAVGTYARGGYSTPMVATENAGLWEQPVQVQEPADAVTGPPTGELTSLSCASTSSCSAVGWYFGASGQEPMVAVDTGGTWGQATELSLPPGAITSGADAQLDSVVCPSEGYCVAVGQYEDTSDHMQAMVDVDDGGVWTASEVTAPGDAAVNPYGSLNSVSCPSQGACVAVGTYENADGIEAMRAVEQGGTWTASQVVPPSDAAATPHVILDAVSCPVLGDCVAVGYYANAAGGDPPMLTTESGGVWAQAISASLPPGSAEDFGVYSSVDCPSAGNCVAVGSYVDNNGSHEGLIGSESGGVWGESSEFPALPTNAIPSGSDIEAQVAPISSVSCLSPVVCSVVGSYQANGQVPSIFAASTIVPALSIATTSLPAATGGSYYSTALAASGGAPGYTWSITGGALPKGLSLSSATGAISGTPMVVGDASFTVQVTDNESPAQATSASLSLNISSPPPPGTRIKKASISSRRRTARFVFTATGQATRFQCALVRLPNSRRPKPAKPSYRVCSSPKTYTHLKDSNYEFYVRSGGLGGTDPTPATHRFKIA